RRLERGLVGVYKTRRVLDRVYGYEVSPVLWKKVMPRLSAGRVQSVATRLVVARERERIAFRPATYWDLEAVFTKVADDAADTAPNEDAASFPARLLAVDGRRVAQGRDFAATGELRNADLLYLSGTATTEAGQADGAGQIPPGGVHRLDARGPASPLNAGPFSRKTVG